MRVAFVHVGGPLDGMAGEVDTDGEFRAAIVRSSAHHAALNAVTGGVYQFGFDPMNVPPVTLTWVPTLGG